jgi:N-acetylglucosamine-6-phosphate deacetylase
MTIGADAQNAPEAIARAKEVGIHVSVGHHMANYEQVRAAADAGAELLTHLGNGCPNLIDRHNNPVWAGLAENRLTAMIISDGHHLPGELVKIIIQTKGVDNVIITSDQVEAAGYKPGRYHVLGNDAILEPNGKLHNPVKKCLVGSASTMSMCMAFLESLNVWSEEELTRLGRTNALKILQ